MNTVTAATPHRRTAVTAIGLLAVAGLSGCGGDSVNDTAELPSTSSTISAAVLPAAVPPAAREFYQQKIAWSPCGSGPLKALECGEAQMPLDWAKPSGEKISLAVLRHKATGKRKGALFLNPGGPGESGVEFAANAVNLFDKKIIRSYDLVGWDPRGVGRSSAVTCLPSSELDAFYAEDVTPDNAAENAASLTASKRFFEACRKNTGPLVDHVDTVSTVKDLDALRVIVGDEKLTYYGASYGTALGLTYAKTFPSTVGRMVLDSIDDTTISAKNMATQQAQSFERTLGVYLNTCGRRKTCSLKGVPEAQRKQKLLTFIAATDTHPIPTAAKRPLTQSLLVTGMAASLYAEAQWAGMDTALAKAFAGDGTEMLTLADGYLGRDESGEYKQRQAALAVISCLDKADPRTDAQRKADALEIARLSPVFGATLMSDTDQCALGKLKGAPVETTLAVKGAPPIVIVASRNDAATPYQWAQHVASMVTPSRMITFNGADHAAYVSSGSKCVTSAVNTYLLDGSLPAPNLTCAG